MDPRFAGFPRRRVIWGQYIMSFSWSLGLWAAVPVIPILSLQLNENIALAGLVVSIGGAGAVPGQLHHRAAAGPVRAARDRLCRHIHRMVFSFLEGISPTYLSLLASGSGRASARRSGERRTRRSRRTSLRPRTAGASAGASRGGRSSAPSWARWWRRGMGDNGRHPHPVLHQRFSKMVCLFVMIFMMVETRQLSARPASAPAPAAAPTQARAAARPPMPRSTGYLGRFFFRVGYAAVSMGAYRR